ncbi:MAG: response regulator [Rhodobacteraceae bacterium]|nr:response regulator [Paracoccaceae bacterium]
MKLREKLQVMVVDDMATSRGLITQALDEMGIVNHFAEADPAEAFKKLAARPVHLVISDFNMPNMDGLQLLEALRRTKSTARIGFILVSGRADGEVLGRGQKLALNNFISKPFDTNGLRACIEKVVGRI